MDSKIGLIIQLNGVVLITVLSLCLRRSLKLTALKYWTMAWLCMSFALICLRLAFDHPEFSGFLFTYYFLGEYLFGFMLVAGCRSLVDGNDLNSRSELYIIPFVLASIVLPQLTADFNDVFAIHALLLAGFYTAAFLHLRRLQTPTFGWHVMHVSLGLLAVDFLFYTFVFSARSIWSFETDILSFNSVIDLVLQTSLGFGMVIILLEHVLKEAKESNEKLLSAQKQLEALVHTDPLTAAFNRHAFYGFVHREGAGAINTAGCVGFFDIDDLKAINDCFGHAAGDMVIRCVARSIREIIRAEDLIYRWGGDEFFVIMVSMNAELAEKRMLRLESLLQHVYIEGIPEPITIGVSWGFTDYTDPTDMDTAIKTADAAMYRRKLQRKQNRPAGFDFIQSFSGAGFEVHH